MPVQAENRHLRKMHLKKKCISPGECRYKQKKGTDDFRNFWNLRIYIYKETPDKKVTFCTGKIRVWGPLAGRSGQGTVVGRGHHGGVAVEAQIRAVHSERESALA